MTSRYHFLGLPQIRPIHVWPQVSAADSAVGLAVKADAEAFSDALPDRNGLSQITDSRTAAFRIAALPFSGQRVQVLPEGVHEQTLPFSNGYVNTFLGFTKK
jgi:hypothetical protein